MDHRPFSEFSPNFYEELSDGQRTFGWPNKCSKSTIKTVKHVAKFA